MNSLAVFYFSGTGNTKFLAEALVDEFHTRGTTATLFAVDEVLRQENPPALDSYDLLGFLYPIHAFNAPDLMFQAIRQLSGTAGKKAFLIKSPGDSVLRGGATSMMRDALERKGMEVIYENYIVMPSNCFRRYPDALIKQLALAGRKKIRGIADEILTGTPRVERNSLMNRCLTALFSSLETHGAKWAGRWFQVSDACIQCDLCVKNCPTQNIRREGARIRFDSKCLLCLRCVYACPQRAISLPWLFKYVAFREWYNLDSILQDSDISDEYVTEQTKVPYKHLLDYFRE